MDSEDKLELLCYPVKKMSYTWNLKDGKESYHLLSSLGFGLVNPKMSEDKMFKLIELCAANSKKRKTLKITIEKVDDKDC